MTPTTIHLPRARPLTGRTVLLAVCGLTLAQARVEAQSNLAGQGTAAAVSTPAAGAQQFATATLPSGGGMANADLDNAGVGNTLGADALTAITSGMVDTNVVSAQTSAEAANVNILNGLITAEQVVALAASYANGQTAASNANGSTLLGLVVNGVNMGDVTPDPNTRIDLPGTGYVVLNEQAPAGDGVTSSGLTVNMIHVVLQSVVGGVVDPLTGQLVGGTLTTTGEILVGSATSRVAR